MTSILNADCKTGKEGEETKEVSKYRLINKRKEISGRKAK